MPKKTVEKKDTVAAEGSVAVDGKATIKAAWLAAEQNQNARRALAARHAEEMASLEPDCQASLAQLYTACSAAGSKTFTVNGAKITVVYREKTKTYILWDSRYPVAKANSNDVPDLG